MKTVVAILTKTIVRSFYKEFALAFLVVLYFCFGFLKSDDHVFLAKYMVTSGFLIGIYFSLWTFYNIFIISYFRKFFREKTSFFLFDLHLVEKPVLLLALFILQLNLFAPVLLYGIFVMGIAYSVGQFLPMASIGGFLVFSSIYPLFFYIRTIANPDVGLSKTSFFKLKFNFKKSPFSFFFFHLMENEWLKLLINKGLSAVLLLALSQILQTDNDDIRPLLIVVLMGFLPNFSLVGSYHAFENQTLFYFKNLPIHINQKWINAIASISILFIPELFLLYRYAWTNLPWYAPVLGYVFGLSLASLYYAGLYLRIAAEERFSNVIFFVAIVCFVAILFKINVLLLSVCILSLAYFTFRKLYYSYEFVVKVQE